MNNAATGKEFTARQLSVAILAAFVSFSAYTCIFSFRKAFNVAPYGGYSILGMDYKVVLIITQVLGYMCSKFYGIKYIAELERIGRGKLIILLVGVSWLAWLLFATLPPPYNFWCLFINGFPLGMLWGIVFSYVEGRRTTDLISAALAVSFIFASGLAKSTAQYVMNTWNVSEYWMPFCTGLIFMPPLLLFVYLLEKIPPPDEADVVERMQRLPMPKMQRTRMIREFFPGLLVLIFIYTLVTVLRELRDSFMADMWRESGVVFNAGVFAQTEAIITVVILLLIGGMILVRNNYRAFVLAMLIMLAGFITALIITMLYKNNHVPIFTWMTGIGLGLYMVYIPFNSILFDRFIAAFHYSGNVGFLIYLADSFGYLGSVGVLFTKTMLSVKINWLGFYMNMVLVIAVCGIAGIIAALLYFSQKRKAYYSDL